MRVSLGSKSAAEFLSQKTNSKRGSGTSRSLVWVGQRGFSRWPSPKCERPSCGYQLPESLLDVPARPSPTEQRAKEFGDFRASATAGERGYLLNERTYN